MLRECPYIELNVIQRKLNEHNKELRAILAKAEEFNKVHHATLLRLKNTLQQDEHDLPAEINNAEAMQVLEKLLEETTPPPEYFDEELERKKEELDRRNNELEEQLRALMAPNDKDEPPPQPESEDEEEHEIVFEEDQPEGDDEEETNSVGVPCAATDEVETDNGWDFDKDDETIESILNENVPNEIEVQTSISVDDESLNSNWENMGNRKSLDKEEVQKMEQTTKEVNQQNHELDEITKKLKRANELSEE